MSPGERAEIAPLGGAVDVDHRLHIVVRDDARARPRVIRASPPRYCGVSVPRDVTGTLTGPTCVSIRYCGICATIG
jgi:hypothetical protein